MPRKSEKSFQLTSKAIEDLKSIALYTEETWGTRQRNIYLKQIDDLFHLIAKSPKKGKSCFEVKEGYYKYNVGKHIIFYRQISAMEIQVVRILHSSMDVPDHL